MGGVFSWALEPQHVGYGEGFEVAKRETSWFEVGRSGGWREKGNESEVNDMVNVL